MFFKKKPKSPLTEIVVAADNISDNLMAFIKDKSYMPTEDDFKTLRTLSEKLHHAYAIAGHTETRLTQRKEGKREESDKFTNNDKFNWHYP